MSTSLHRRHLLLASLAFGATASTGAQPAAAAGPADALALKLMIVGRRKPGTTLAEHRQHIRHVHGELVLRYIAADPAHAPRRYVQNPVIDGSDPFALNRDFVTQIWFPDFAALQASLQTPFYLTQLKGDEDNFVDQPTVVFMPTRERTLFTRTTPSAGAAVKLFVMLQKAPGAEADAFKRGWAAAPAALQGLAVGARLQRYAQNDTLPTPKDTAPLDGIDEFWLDDEASARALLPAWQAWVRESLVRPGLVAENGHFALLANEQVLHAGPR